MNYNMLNKVASVKLAGIIRQLGQSIVDKANVLESYPFLNQKDLSIIGQNKKFQNFHKNKRAFVLANGPSLKKLDLKKIKKEDITIGVSGIYKHPDLKSGRFHLNYLALLDRLFFSYKPEILSIYNELDKGLGETKFLFPLARGYGFIKDHNLLRNKEIIYAATYGNETSKIDFTKVIPGFQTVATFSIAWAIYLGCNPIYLLGYDHDYLANREMDSHFYNGSIIKGHITESKAISEIYTYYDTMKFMMKFWENHLFFKNIAVKNNIKIYNATQGGYLDVFERKKYDDLF